MKKIILIFVGLLSITLSAWTQVRVVDAIDQSPIAAASVFDHSGNMIGLTWIDGTVVDIPESAYPISLRFMGYDLLTIDSPAAKTWHMKHANILLDELVIVPVKRNVLKQTFYVREYLSMNTSTDTATFFNEHMADRFIPAEKGAKFKGNSDLRLLNTRSYALISTEGKDSLMFDTKPMLPSMIDIFELDDDPIHAPESFSQTTTANKIYEEAGKHGPSVIIRQNGNLFTYTEDGLADKKGHTWSPWPLKLLGFTMEVNQMYITQGYRANDKGIYQAKDLNEVNYVLEATGRGKHIRKIFRTDEHVNICTMIELYVIDQEFLSADEVKEEREEVKKVAFEIPSSVMPLNKATQRLIERATTAH